MDDVGSIERSSQSVRHVLPVGRRIAYSVGHFLNDLSASMWFSYLLTYQQSVLQFGTKNAGTLMLIGQVADAISTTFVGFESDRHDSFFRCGYGKRKTWHLIGTVCVAATFPFLFMTCIECSHSSKLAQSAYYAAFIMIFQFGWASVQISHLSLIPDLTPISAERVELNALRYAMIVTANVCVYATMWLVLGVNSGEGNHIGPGDAPVFKHVALAMVGIGLLFTTVFHVFVKEKPPNVLLSDHLIINESEEYEKPQLLWKEWFTQPQFYMVALLYMASRLYVNLSQIYLPLYVEKTLDLHKNNIAIMPLVVYISSFMSSFAIKYMNIHLGNKITYFIGCLIAITVGLWIFFGEDDNYRFIQIYAVSALNGIAGSTVLIVSLSITADLISNSIMSSAFVFGCMSFLDKLSSGLMVAVIQNLHPCMTDVESCKKFYKYVLVFACGSAAILGLIALSMLTTQTIGVRRNEDQLSCSRQGSRSNSQTNLRKSLCENDDCKPLLPDDDDDAILSDQKIS